MRRTARNNRGFTGVEILLVLVVIGILAGAGYAATGHYRARAAEAEMRQDLVHFVNQQQVLRQRTGSLGTLEQLGFRRSPGVVVEEDRLDGGGRRAYLRVRHVKTGQRCSVDYSPYVSNALNRVQCWAGEDDPDSTENVGPIDGAATPPVASTPVDSVVPPVCATPASCSCEAVPAPELTGPADQGGVPGGSGSGTFTLANSGPAARTYSLRFSSSNPAVVPSVDGPPSITVPPGASRTVSSTFQLDAGAEAGQATVLPLEASDAACPAVTGNAFFTVSTDLVLADPTLARPADVTVPPDSAFQVAWTSANRTNAARMMVLTPREGAGLVRGGSAELGSQPYARGETRSTPVEYRLDATVDGGTRTEACLQLHDAEAARHQSPRQCFAVTARFIARAPVLESAPADRRQNPGTERNEVWRVRATSNAARRYRIQLASAGDVQIVDSANVGPAVLIGRDQYVDVRVTYRVAARSLAESRGSVSLLVEDADPAYAQATRRTSSFAVTTELVLAPPLVASPASASAAPGSSVSRSYLLTNRSNAPRVFSLALASSNPAHVADPADPASVVVGAFDSVRVPLTAVLADRVAAGNGSELSLGATDAGAPAMVASGAFSLTASLVLRSPSASWSSTSRGADPGAAFQHAYTVTNQSNGPRTLCPALSTADAAVLALDGGSPGCTRFEAYEAKSFPAGPTFRVPPRLVAGTGTTASLSAYDSAAAGYASPPAAFAFTVNLVDLAPQVARSSPDGAEYAPETSHTMAFAVTNQSNTRRFLSFTSGSSAPGVVPAPGAPAGAWFEAYETRPVQLSFHMNMVRAGSRSDLSLGATNTTTGDAAPAAGTGAVTAPAPRAPVVADGAPVSGRHGEERTIVFRVSNPGNSDRTFSFTAASSNTAIVASFAAVPSVTIPAFGSAEVELRFPFAAAASSDLSAELTLRATDAGIPQLTAAGTGTATRINTPPALALTFTRSHPTGRANVTATANAADADGTVSSVEWWLTDPDGTRAALGSGPAVSFQANRKGTWQLHARAADNNGAFSETAALAIAVRNDAPAAAPAFTPDGQLTFTPITLTANGSDPDGDAITYEWFTISPAGVVAPAGNAAQAVFQADRPGTWYAEVVVDDGEGGRTGPVRTGPITVLNRAPTAQITETIVPDPYLDEIQFHPNASDLDGSVVSYQWRMQSVSTQSWYELGGEAEPRAYFSKYGQYTIVTVHPSGTYDIHLTVTDNDGATFSTSKRFSIKPGCTDEGANNFDPEASYDDGSCTYGPTLVKHEELRKTEQCEWEQQNMVYSRTTVLGRMYHYWSDGTQTRDGDDYVISSETRELGLQTAQGTYTCEYLRDEDWP